MTPADLEGIPDRALVRLTVEGRMRHEADKRLLMPLDHPFGVILSRLGSSFALLLMATAIEVLPEPVVEPTGLWAVVTDSDGRAWVREESGRWRSPHWGPRGWSGLADGFGPLTVLFEGVPE